MPIEITQQPNPDCFIPTQNCQDSTVCVEDTGLIEAPATPAFVVVSIVAGIPIGDTFTLFGETFTAVTGTAESANDVVIQPDMGASLIASLESHPDFGTAYTYTLTGATVTITANEAGEHPTFINNVNGTTVTLAQEVQGTEIVTKSDYYFFLRIKDNATGELVCVGNDNELQMKATLSADKDTATACFDLQGVFKTLSSLYASAPDTDNPFLSIDTNQTGSFNLCVFGSYLASGEDCKKVQTPLVEVGDICPVAHYISTEPDEFCGLMTEPSGFVAADNFIACSDADAAVCTDSCVEWRLAVRDTDNVIVLVRHTYTDGSTGFFINTIAVPDDKAIIRFFICPDKIGADPNRTLQSSLISALSISPVGCLSERTVNWSTAKPCCDCHDEFMFLSACGNNETLIGECADSADVSVEFGVTCKQVKCGSFDGGLTPFSVKAKKTYKTRFRADNPALLESFLTSPRIYQKIDGQYRRVISEAATYSIKQRNSSNFITFIYSLSVSRRGNWV